MNDKIAIEDLGRRLAQAEAAMAALTKSEAILRESEARFRTAFELSSVGQLHLDPDDLRVRRANRKACAMYGYSHTALTQLSMTTLTHIEDQEAYADQIGRLLAGEIEEIAVEKRVVTASGSVLTVEVGASLLRNATGQPAEIIEIVQDVTPRRQAERALSDSEARLRAAFAIDTVGIMFWQRSENYVLKEANDAFLRMIDYAREEAFALTCDNLTLPEFHAASHERLRQAEAEGGFDPFEKQMRRRDGSPWWGLFAARVVGDDLVEFVIDVTERRRTEEALRAGEARQQVLIDELQHRTRNLMAVVRAMADTTMARSADLADFRARYGDRLAALARVQGLLSRLAEGKRITFDELIRVELAAVNGAADKVVLQGPDGVALRSSTIQTFALALHELATNASKYGAFAQARGRLAVRWRVEHEAADARPWLHVDWRERDVVMPDLKGSPQGGGSGRELIERALPYQLGARTSFVMAADGIHCTMALPVSEHTSLRQETDD